MAARIARCIEAMGSLAGRHRRGKRGISASDSDLPNLVRRICLLIPTRSSTGTTLARAGLAVMLAVLVVSALAAYPVPLLTVPSLVPVLAAASFPHCSARSTTGTPFACHGASGRIGGARDRA
jgi:hypothetical protein